MQAALIRARRSVVERQQKMSAVFGNQTQPPIFLVASFVWLQIALVPFRIAQFFLELPIHLYKQSMEAFSLMALRDEHGSFLESYQAHVRRLRISVATVTLTFVALGSGLSFLGYSLYTVGKPTAVEASSTINVSGILYSNEGVTAIDCSAASHTVKLRVNGVGSASTTCTLNTGAYSFSGITVNAGDVITVWISGATEKATTVTRASTSDISGLNLYGNAIIVRHEDAGPITNTNLGQCDSVNGTNCADADIKFSISAGSLTVASGSELFVWTGKSYTPGGSFTTNATGGGLHVAASATITVDTDSTVAQNIVIDSSGLISINSTKTLTNSGTTDISNAGTISGAGTLRFTSSTTGGPGTGGTISSIVRYDASAANIPAAVFDARTYGGDLELYSNVAAVRSITFIAGTYTVSGNFKVITGSLQNGALTAAGATNNPTVNITGNLSYTKGGAATPAISTGTGTWTVTGNATFTGGTWTATSGNTLVMNGAGTTLTGGSPTTSFYNLTIGANAVSAGAVTFNVNHALTVAVGNQLNTTTGHTVNLGSTATLTLTGTIGGSGTLLYQNTVAFPSTGTISSTLMYTPYNGSVTITSRTYDGWVNCQDNGVQVTTCYLTGSPVFNSGLSFNATVDGIVLDAATNNPNVSVAGKVIATSGEVSATLNMGSGTWSVGGDFDMSSTTVFNNNGGTLNMNGTGSLYPNGLTFNNFSTSGTGTVTLINSTDITIAGNLNLGASATLDPGGSKIVMTGSGKTITANGHALYDLMSSSGSVSVVDANLTVHSLDINGGTFTAPSGTLTVNGDFTHSGGVFTANNGTVSFATTSTATITGTTTFKNISSTVAGKSIKFVAATAGTPVFTVSGTLTLTGSSGSHIALSSATPSSQWLAHFSGTQSSITNANILDSGCDTGTANVNLDNSSLNAGNNGTCWVFTTPTLTVNDGAGVDATYTTSTTTLSGNWGISDATGVDHYEYAIGTTVGGTNVVTYTTTALVTNFTNSSLTLTSGTTYYVAVRAKNSFGVVMGSANSNGVLDDSVAPATIITVNDGVGADVAWTTSTTTLSANWTASSDATSGLQKYQYAIGTTSGGTQTLTWTDNGLTTSVTNLGLTLVNGTTYYVSVRALDNAGNTSVVSTSNGILVNTAAPLITNHQPHNNLQRIADSYTYNVIFSKAATGPQIDYAQFTVYSAGVKAGTQLIPWTNIFTGAVDSYSTPWTVNFNALQEGENYISVQVHALDGLATELDDAFVISKDTIAPTAPATVNDGSGADATYSNSLTTLAANWTGSTDATSGVAMYEYAIGTTAGGTDVVTWTNTGLAMTFTRSDLTLANGVTYYTSVRATDVAGNVSGVATSNGVTVNTALPGITDNQAGDTTARNSAGTTYHIQFTKALTGSQIDYAQYTVYSGAGKTGTQIQTWTNIFTGAVDSYTTPWAVDFSALQEGTNYISVRVHALDGLSSELDDAFSVVKDTIAPTISSFMAATTDSSATLTWTTNEPATTKVAYGLTNSYGTATAVDPTLVTHHSVTINGLANNTAFHAVALVSDGAGNTATSSDLQFTTQLGIQTYITAVQVTDITSTSVLVTWITNEPATSKVRYGTTTSYGLEVDGLALTTNHSLIISGLLPNQAYHYEVISVGHTTDTDADATFQTIAITPTTVTVVAPNISALVLPPTNDGNTLTINGRGRPGQTITFRLDGKIVGQRKLSLKTGARTSFTFNLVTSGLSIGKHRLTARANDTAGHLSSISTKTIIIRSGSTPTKTVATTNHGGTYVVQPGDSLWKIAQHYLANGIDYNRLVAANVAAHPSLATHPNIIQPGWTLTVPAP